MEGRSDWDIEADVIVIGSGAAGLSAALTAAVGSARVVILEKSHMIGGTTAMSGAGTWVPANHHMLAAGYADSPEEALRYLRATAPDGWAETEDALWEAFVEHAPDMLKFLEAHTPLQFKLIHHPDLYVEEPGGKAMGRMVTPRMISLKAVGPWRGRIRKAIKPQIFTYEEVITGPVLREPVRSIAKLSPRLLYRLLTRRVAMGGALVVGLLRGCLDHGCKVMTDARAERLLTDGEHPNEGRVIGVEATIAGLRQAIRAAKGVVLATGGFEWDGERLERYFPSEFVLNATPRTNTGDGHRMAERVGAKLARMDQANIYPVAATRYEGQRHGFPIILLDFPHCILVNRHGKRFVSEGDRNIGLILAERDPATRRPLHLPAWRIFDTQFVRRNRFLVRLSKGEPGGLRRATSIPALAQTIGLDPAALGATVERFNRFVANGKDEDFQRGETAWEMFSTRDPTKPNGNGALGAIDRPPFYAAPYHVGMLGTKGGPRTDRRAQVLREDGSLVPGLYCAGVAMANPIGTKNVGAGTTIGPCLTWGYIAGRNLLLENR